MANKVQLDETVGSTLPYSGATTAFLQWNLDGMDPARMKIGVVQLVEGENPRIRTTKTPTGLCFDIFVWAAHIQVDVPGDNLAVDDNEWDVEPAVGSAKTRKKNQKERERKKLRRSATAESHPVSYETWGDGDGPRQGLREPESRVLMDSSQSEQMPSGQRGGADDQRWTGSHSPANSIEAAWGSTQSEDGVHRTGVGPARREPNATSGIPTSTTSDGVSSGRDENEIFLHGRTGDVATGSIASSAPTMNAIHDEPTPSRAPVYPDTDVAIVARGSTPGHQTGVGSSPAIQAPPPPLAPDESQHPHQGHTVGTPVWTPHPDDASISAETPAIKKPLVSTQAISSQSQSSSVHRARQGNYPGGETLDHPQAKEQQAGLSCESKTPSQKLQPQKDKRARYKANRRLRRQGSANPSEHCPGVDDIDDGSTQLTWEMIRREPPIGDWATEMLDF